MKSVGLLLAFLCVPCWGWAQPVVVTAAHGIAFTASPDHAAVLADGSAMLTRYELRFVPASGAAPVAAVPLGKPTPTSGNQITVKPIAAFGTLAANVAYTAVIVAIGPGGEGVGAASSPFVRLVPIAPAAPGPPSVVP